MVYQMSTLLLYVYNTICGPGHTISGDDYALSVPGLHKFVDNLFDKSSSEREGEIKNINFISICKEKDNNNIYISLVRPLKDDCITQLCLTSILNTKKKMSVWHKDFRT